MSAVQQHLQGFIAVAKMGGYTNSTGLFDFLLRWGIQFKPRSLPSTVRRGPMKNCYENATLLAVEKGYTYCEGYAAGIIPVAHAFCIDKQGFVIDNTWARDYGQEYFGIPFNTQFLLDSCKKQRYYGLIDAWQAGWPLLRMSEPDLLGKAFAKNYFELKRALTQ